jgi:hypothetical protein
MPFPVPSLSGAGMSNRTVRLQVTAAIAWSAALIPGALFLPIANPQMSASQLRVQGGHHWISLTQNSGPGILWIPILTLVLALGVALLLAHQSTSIGLGSSRLATGIGVIVVVGAAVGTVTFLVGIFLLPAGVLILLASGEARHVAKSGAAPLTQSPTGSTV